MYIKITPEAREFILDKGSGEFTLDMMTARG